MVIVFALVVTTKDIVELLVRPVHRCRDQRVGRTKSRGFDVVVQTVDKDAGNGG